MFVLPHPIHVRSSIASQFTCMCRHIPIVQTAVVCCARVAMLLRHATVRCAVCYVVVLCCKGLFCLLSRENLLCAVPLHAMLCRAGLCCVLTWNSRRSSSTHVTSAGLSLEMDATMPLWGSSPARHTIAQHSTHDRFQHFDRTSSSHVCPAEPYPHPNGCVAAKTRCIAAATTTAAAYDRRAARDDQATSGSFLKQAFRFRCCCPSCC
jgi:hypothetical protein